MYNSSILNKYLFVSALDGNSISSASFSYSCSYSSLVRVVALLLRLLLQCSLQSLERVHGCGQHHHVVEAAVASVVAFEARGHRRRKPLFNEGSGHADVRIRKEDYFEVGLLCMLVLARANWCMVVELQKRQKAAIVRRPLADEAEAYFLQPLKESWHTHTHSHRRCRLTMV